MTGIFLYIFNRGIAAGWIVLAVLLLRPFLRKAPKWVNCLLWCVVALRLILPFTVESMISLIPSPEVIPQDILVSQTPAIHSGIPAVNSAVNPMFTAPVTPAEGLLEKGLLVVSAMWLAGFGMMLLYSLVTYIGIRRQVRGSLVYQGNIYVCDDVESPFILGTFRPRVYIPSGMEEAHLTHVLAHENAHIKRGDHWWKPLSFLLLAVYWFHPLLWVAYILLCRDIEMACDEKVVTGMDSAGKMGYSEALIACSVHRRLIMSCPVAFGELSVKARIKRVLCYKKPGIWVALAAVAVCVFTAGCFLTDPMPCGHSYQSQVAEEATCTVRGVEKHTCTLCEHTYTTYIDMCAHNYDQFVVNQEATCTAEGLGTRICSGCGKEKSASIGKLPHTAGEPFLIYNANCTEEGTKSATCSDCGEVFVAEILPTNGVHDMQETVTQKPTCTEAGTGTKTCSRCGISETVYYKPLGHSYGPETTQKYSTCTEEGRTQKVCANCGDSVWSVIPKANHFWIRNSVAGYSMCRICGTTENDGDRQYEYEFFQSSNTNQSSTTPKLPVICWDVASSVVPKPGVG